MTDHTEKALHLITNPDGLTQRGQIHHHMALLTAQVHATLALAQEQRTRNLIALFQVPDDDANDFIEEGISYLDVLNEIREGLGV